jgi:hypothetical protein
MPGRKKPRILKADSKPPPPVPEAFIGHDASTMMTEETFEEFEARMRAQQAPPPAQDEGRTNTTPALEVQEEPREAPPGEPARRPPGESFLPDEVPGGEEETREVADDDDDFLPPEA